MQIALNWSCKQVVLFLVPGVLLVLRGCTGVAALYKEYVWENDHFFYLLDTLPEMMAILVFIWPYLLVRCRFLTQCCR